MRAFVLPTHTHTQKKRPKGLSTSQRGAGTIEPLGLVAKVSPHRTRMYAERKAGDRITDGVTVRSGGCDLPATCFSPAWPGPFVLSALPSRGSRPPRAWRSRQSFSSCHPAGTQRASQCACGFVSQSWVSLHIFETMDTAPALESFPAMSGVLTLLRTYSQSPGIGGADTPYLQGGWGWLVAPSACSGSDAARVENNRTSLNSCDHDGVLAGRADAAFPAV
ncbi:hypothetical protein VTJ83DRAFT_5844 [Remersonia thermophila]|uniref:Uncharacterized protein n=1 Tax=Remersonia thermophila TaxID=72144 RepID=A0ABR4DA75_9PEZI